MRRALFVLTLLAAGGCATVAQRQRADGNYRCPRSEARIEGNITGYLSGQGVLTLVPKRDRFDVVLSMLQENGELFVSLSGSGVCERGALRAHFDRGFRPSAWKTQFRGDFFAMLGDGTEAPRAIGVWSTQVIGKMKLAGGFGSHD